MVMHKLKKKNLSVNLETGLYVTTDQVDGERLPCKTKPNNVYVLDTYSTPNYLNIFEENYSKKIALVVIVKNYESFLYEFRGYKNLFKTLPPVKKTNPVEIYKKIDKNEEGIKISFFPKIFDSIHTSLANPQKYLSEEKMVHKIYKILMEEEATLNSLSKKFKVCVKETVKSMLYAQIIQLKNGKYFINPKLQIYK